MYNANLPVESDEFFLDIGIVVSISDGIVGIIGLENVANVKSSNF